MRDEMRTAYKLIGDFKSGAIAPGETISEDQDRLLRLLAADLDVPTDGLGIGAIASRVAHADTQWNREAMAAVCEFHDQREAGAAEEAEAVRARFMARCPSVWYSEVLASL
jgi:hypothetical protein